MTAFPASREPFQACTFDLWYTLVYQTPAERGSYRRRWRAAWREALRSAGVPASVRGTVLAGVESQAEEREHRGESWPLDRQADWASHLTRADIDHAALAGSIELALRRSSVHLVPGAREVLGELKRRGLRLGLVSNVRHETSRAIHELLERTGLSELLAVTILSCDLPFAKPSPEPVRRCLALLGVPPGRAVHVGDLPSDVAAARAAGAEPWLFVGTDRVGPKKDRRERRAFDGEAVRLHALPEMLDHLR